jgi:hypothetical protein
MCAIHTPGLRPNRQGRPLPVRTRTSAVASTGGLMLVAENPEVCADGERGLAVTPEARGFESRRSCFRNAVVYRRFRCPRREGSSRRACEAPARSSNRKTDAMLRAAAPSPIRRRAPRLCESISAPTARSKAPAIPRAIHTGAIDTRQEPYLSERSLAMPPEAPSQAGVRPREPQQHR